MVVIDGVVLAGMVVVVLAVGIALGMGWKQFLP